MSIKESVILKCDICDKTETRKAVSRKIAYPVDGWYLNKRLEWNEFYSTSLDFCSPCFESAFGDEEKPENKKEACASLFKRFFQGKCK